MVNSESHSDFRGPFLRFGLVAVILSMTACGGGGGGGGNSNATQSTPTAQATFNLTPSVLDFGKTVVGANVRGAVVIENTGTRSFDMEVLDLGEGFSIEDQCDVVEPAAECRLLIEFSPVEQKVYSSDAVIAANTTQLPLDLRGEGQGLNVEILNLEQSCASSEVSVEIAVTSAGGGPVAGLRQENLTVLIDGVEVTLASDLVAVDDRNPVAVGILLDWSLSLEDFRPQLLDATGLFVDSLEATDVSGLYRFADGIDYDTSQELVAADSAGKQALTDALYKSFDSTGQGSRIWNPVDTVATKLLAESIEERVIILLTDGLSNTGMNLDTLLSEIEGAGVRVYTVGYGDVDPSPLQSLADVSGGLFFSDPTADGLIEAYQKIGVLLTERYIFQVIAPDGAAAILSRFTDDAGLEGEDAGPIPDCI